MFDLSKRNVFLYNGNYRLDKVVLATNEVQLYKNYECYTHSYISKRCVNKKIKLILANFEILTVDLSYLALKGDLYYPKIKLYYRVGNFKAGPVVICFLFECVEHTVDEEEFEACYAFRDLIDGSKNEQREVRLCDLNLIPQKNMNRYTLDKLYKKTVTTVDIFIHNTVGIYRGGFTIDTNGDNFYSYVSVQGPLRAGGVYKFVKFIHTPNVDYFIKMDIKCPKGCCKISEFCDNNYNSANVSKVMVYFKHEDRQRNFPLAFKIVPQKGNVTFYRLHAIENDQGPDPTQWVKRYIMETLTFDDNEDQLDDIYDAHRDKIEKIIHQTDPYQKIFNGVLYGTIASSLILLSVSIGLYIKLNHESIMAAASNVYARLR